jgi:hypothetical protein
MLCVSPCRQLESTLLCPYFISVILKSDGIRIFIGHVLQTAWCYRQFTWNVIQVVNHTLQVLPNLPPPLSVQADSKQCLLHMFHMAVGLQRGRIRTYMGHVIQQYFQLYYIILIIIMH